MPAFLFLRFFVHSRPLERELELAILGLDSAWFLGKKPPHLADKRHQVMVVAAGPVPLITEVDLPAKKLAMADRSRTAKRRMERLLEFVGQLEPAVPLLR